MSTNLDGENKYCVLFDEKCDIPYTDLESSIITIKIIKPYDYLIFGICDSSLKDNIGSLFNTIKENKKELPIFAINVDGTKYNFMNINEKEQKDEKDVKEQADFNKISRINCSYDPNKYTLEFSIDGKSALNITDFKNLELSYLSPFLMISKNCELKTDFSYL